MAAAPCSAEQAAPNPPPATTLFYATPATGDSVRAPQANPALHAAESSAFFTSPIGAVTLIPRGQASALKNRPSAINASLVSNLQRSSPSSRLSKMSVGP